MLLSILIGSLLVLLHHLNSTLFRRSFRQRCAILNLPQLEGFSRKEIERFLGPELNFCGFILEKNVAFHFKPLDDLPVLGTIGQLESIVGISQSALSQHLAILRKNKIVKTRRSAQTIFYKVANKDIMLMINRIFELFIQPEPSINIKDSARNYKSKNTKPPLF